MLLRFDSFVAACIKVSTAIIGKVGHLSLLFDSLDGVHANEH